MWISHLKWPLNVDEICHALAVQIRLNTHINTNNVLSIWTVLRCFQGLSAIEDGSSTIGLIHFTLKKYLFLHVDLFDKPHSKMAETCLAYLNFRGIKDLSARPSRDLLGTPFLRYSSPHRGIHMRMKPSDHSRSLELELLHQFYDHISTGSLWRSTVDQCFHFHRQFSALYCISYFGIAEVAIDLINMRTWDMNRRDSMDHAPLVWATGHRHGEVAKLLSQRKHIQAGASNMVHGRTALSWVAQSGHEELLGYFLQGSEWSAEDRLGLARPGPSLV